MRIRPRLSQFAPITLWLPECSWKTARANIVAGVAVAELLIPEGMAYGGIAGGSSADGFVCRSYIATSRKRE